MQDTSSEQFCPFLPSLPQPDNPPAYLLLPVYPLQRRRRRHCCCFRVLSASSFLIAGGFSILILTSASPSSSLPTLSSVVRLCLYRFRVTPLPSV
ncbi:hypothetical protein IEQ34_021835 [Dendrobium chrysotoxum]|uniref:Uncharacterized protein n=1 Tax=Dendrobium chrysotoxum TaxID=161865 RepID=A0AAV7FJW6_DENCH|nr:hypothetical protein IEQ34_021835 [Dendrobium chrysotoxum]